MNVKQLNLNTFTAHPKIAIFGMGLATTFVIGTAKGRLDHSQVAFSSEHEPMRNSSALGL